jgi:hypothetical protein
VAILQAKSLSAGGGWVVEHPLPQVDAEGRFYPGSPVIIQGSRRALLGRL